MPALFLTEINNISININTTSIASEIINLLPQDWSLSYFSWLINWRIRLDAKLNNAFRSFEKCSAVGLIIPGILKFSSIYCASVELFSPDMVVECFYGWNRSDLDSTVCCTCAHQQRCQWNGEPVADCLHPLRRGWSSVLLSGHSPKRAWCTPSQSCSYKNAKLF